MLYEGKVHEVYGYVQGVRAYRDDEEETNYCILKDGDGLTVVDEDDVHSPVSIDELDCDGLEQLWRDIRRGSMYTDDYRNTLDVPDAEAMAAWESFYHELCEEYGEFGADEHDTAKEFAEWYHCQLVA